MNTGIVSPHIEISAQPLQTTFTAPFTAPYPQPDAQVRATQSFCKPSICVKRSI